MDLTVHLVVTELVVALTWCVRELDDGVYAIITTFKIHPPVLCPRTTRRNMLSTELTESLRKHLLWYRQVNAALKRRYTAQDMTNLNTFPGESQWNTYLDSGLQVV